MLIVDVICIILGGVCGILGVGGISVFIAEKRVDWRDLALGLFFLLVAVICFYAAYVGGVA